MDLQFLMGKIIFVQADRIIHYFGLEVCKPKISLYNDCLLKNEKLSEV